MRFQISIECDDEETARNFVRLSNIERHYINGEMISNFRYEGKWDDTERNRTHISEAGQPSFLRTDKVCSGYGKGRIGSREAG